MRLESHREAILSRVIATRAHTMGGLKAKARLYSLESVANLQEPHERLALSIVADLNNADLPPEPDLSACSIQQIARLYEALHATYEHLSSLSQLPCFWGSAGYMLRHEYNPAGKIIEREADRLAGLANHCVDEIARRDASSDNETDEILITLVTRELSSNGRIHDPALMRDIATAWGA